MANPTGKNNRLGTKNKAKVRRIVQVQDFVEKIFQVHDPVKLAARFLDSEDDSVASKVYIKLLEYKFGLPEAKSKTEVTGTIGVQFINHLERPIRPLPQ